MGTGAMQNHVLHNEFPTVIAQVFHVSYKHGLGHCRVVLDGRPLTFNQVISLSRLALMALALSLLSSSQLPSQLGKDPTGSKGRRSNGDGQEGKPRKKRSEAKVCRIYLSECTHICENKLSIE